jgi:hypothetical protein
MDNSTRKKRYLILAEVLVLAGLISFATIGSCRFVDATIENIVGDLPVPLQSYLPSDGRRGLGFLFFELENGKSSNCLSEEGSDLGVTLQKTYKDFLGRDWRAPRAFGCTAIGLSFLSLVVICFPCTGTALFLVIPIVFQSVTFAVITSDFCADADCKLGSGAKFSIAAVLLFFFSGLALLAMGEPPLLVMGEHPGGEDAEAEVAAATGKGAHEEASLADTEDTEELTVELR